tara:strand:- start:183 stop:356 length:174 start_codon:yes stop_codon:yes gene_type:complete
MDKIKSLFASRRFWVAVAAGLVAGAKQLGFELSPDLVTNAVLICGAWIVGDSLRETK